MILKKVKHLKKKCYIVPEMMRKYLTFVHVASKAKVSQLVLSQQMKRLVSQEE